MRTRLPVFYAIRQELYDWKLWVGRGVVPALAIGGALVASGVSRLISAPLYASLARLQLQRLRQPEV